MNRKYRSIVIGIVSSTLWACSQSVQYDIVVLNGTIVDGTGSKSYQADMGINGDTIAFIGELEESNGRSVIDATGKTVSPGFIDIHTHCDFGLDEPETRGNLTYLMQGVTSVVTGNCGYRNHSLAYTQNLYDSIGGIGTNALPLIGFGSVRYAILGDEDRAPNPQELDQMKQELRKNLDFGAWGMSSGLQYVPQVYSSQSEVIEVASVLGEYGAIYTTHMRSEEEEIMEALEEALTISKNAGIPLNISHLKANGRENWKFMDSVMAVVEQAQAAGQQITADMYPYDKSATTELYTVIHVPKNLKVLYELKRVLNDDLTGNQKTEARDAYLSALQEALEDPVRYEQIKALTEEGIPGVTNWVAKGGWNYFSVVDAPNSPEVINRMIIEVSEQIKKEPFKVAAELIVKNGDRVVISLSTMLEKNMVKQMKKDWVMFSSDGYAVNPDDTGVHPRSYGSAARVLRKYIRDQQILSPEEGVYKMTGMVAETLGLKGRGELKRGFVADVIVFDPEQVVDKSTYLEPHHHSEGVSHVILNGKLSVVDGKFTDDYNGKFLLKKYD